MNPEKAVGIAALLGLAVVGCWRLLRWFGNAKPTPNPWDEEKEGRIHQPDAVPICTRCLDPHEPEARFCPNCGVPVDPLVPFSPYFYIFAFGDVLTAGIAHRFPLNWITVMGFLLLPLAYVPLIFAPVYWFFFFRNRSPHQSPPSASSDRGANSGSSVG